MEDIDDALRRLLEHDGALPRRAVLEEGRVVPKTRPDQRECSVVSRCCDIVSRTTRAPREPRALLEQCIAMDSLGAWAAARDDIATGDLDSVDVLEALGVDGPGPVLARTASPDAFLVLGQLSECPVMPDDTVALVIQNALNVSDGLDHESAVLTSLGGLLRHHPPTAAMADLFLDILRTNGPRGVRPFLQMRLDALTQHRPQMVRALMASAEKAPLLHRYPPLAALATIVQASPAQFRGLDCTPLAKSTIVGMVDGRGKLDVRMTGAVGVLASLSEDPYIRALGNAITTLAAQCTLARTKTSAAVHSTQVVT